MCCPPTICCSWSSALTIGLDVCLKASRTFFTLQDMSSKAHYRLLVLPAVHLQAICGWGQDRNQLSGGQQVCGGGGGEGGPDAHHHPHRRMHAHHHSQQGLPVPSLSKALAPPHSTCLCAVCSHPGPAYACPSSISTRSAVHLLHHQPSVPHCS